LALSVLVLSIWASGSCSTGVGSCRPAWPAALQLQGNGAPATTAEFNGPGGLAVARNGSMPIVGTFSERIRMITGLLLTGRWLGAS